MDRDKEGERIVTVLSSLIQSVRSNMIRWDICRDWTDRSRLRETAERQYALMMRIADAYLVWPEAFGTRVLELEGIKRRLRRMEAWEVQIMTALLHLMQSVRSDLNRAALYAGTQRETRYIAVRRQLDDLEKMVRRHRIPPEAYGSSLREMMYLYRCADYLPSDWNAYTSAVQHWL